MPCRRQPAHAGADPGNEHAGRQLSDSGDAGRNADHGTKRIEARLDLSADPGDCCIEHADPLKMQFEREPMMPASGAPPQGLGQIPRRRLDPAMGKLGQAGLARGQRCNHRPSALAHNTGDHRVQLDVALLQRLPRALDMGGALSRQLLAVRGRARCSCVRIPGTKLPRISP